MNMKHKNFRLRIEVKDDPANPEAHTIEGWASTFGNKDSDNDIVVPGAFQQSLTERMPKMLWQHDSRQPVGVWTAATETAQGLYVKGQLLDTTLGNDVYKMLKAGAISDMSIGYTTIDSSMDWDSGTRTLKQVDLWEVSLVTFPANDQANITGVKAMAEDVCAAHTILEQAKGICSAYMGGDMEPTKEAFATVHDHIKNAQSMLQEPDEDDPDKSRKHTPKTLERLLREAGLTRGEARGLLAKGYHAITEQREAASEPHPELALLFNQFR